jgi:hypothetical protein
MKRGHSAFSVMMLLTIPFVGCPTHCVDPDVPAIAAIKKVQIAEAEFLGRCGRYGELKELGRRGAGLLSSELTKGNVNGHKLVLAVGQSHYSVQTIPIGWQKSGFRSFYSDETLVLRKSDGPAAANYSSPVLP